MKKIQRHDALSVSTAPIRGPAMEEIPQTPANSACARARSWSENMSPMMTMPSGSMPPAPTPCRARKAMSCVIDVATPHNIDPSRNNPIATRYGRRRPWTSAMRPHTGVVTVDVSM